jgi:hypothetical protein
VTHAYAPVRSLLGALERGRGSAVAYLRHDPAQALLVYQCAAHDTRWDQHRDSRAGYLARLVRDLRLDPGPLIRQLHAGTAAPALTRDILQLLATAGDPQAREALSAGAAAPPRSTASPAAGRPLPLLGETQGSRDRAAAHGLSVPAGTTDLHPDERPGNPGGRGERPAPPGVPRPGEARIPRQGGSHPARGRAVVPGPSANPGRNAAAGPLLSGSLGRNTAPGQPGPVAAPGSTSARNGAPDRAVPVPRRSGEPPMPVGPFTAPTTGNLDAARAWADRPDDGLRYQAAVGFLARHGSGRDVTALFAAIGRIDGWHGYDRLTEGLARIIGPDGAEEPEGRRLARLLRGLLKESPHTAERAGYLRSLLVIDPEHTAETLPAHLFDCEAAVRLIAARHTPLTEDSRRWLAELRDDPIEDPEVRAAARSALAAP